MDAKSHVCVDAMNNKQLVDLLLELPKKILRHEDLAALSQIILHELCHKDRLDLKKATYLIDNPDFGCMKGVAGFCQNECKLHKQDLWQDPQGFDKDMSSADFHNKIQGFRHDSLSEQALKLRDSKELIELGKEMGIADPNIYTWDMRHGNRGILMFEDDKADTCQGACKKDAAMLDKVSAMLGLCRVH